MTPCSLVFLALSLAMARLSYAESAAQLESAVAANTLKNPEWAGLFGDASLPVVWQSAVAAQEKIAAALAEKKLDGIPDWSETIHLASHALQAQAKADDPDPAGKYHGRLPTVGSDRRRHDGWSEGQRLQEDERCVSACKTGARDCTTQSAEGNPRGACANDPVRQKERHDAGKK